MRIRIQSDSKSIYLEVPDEDCTVMIDADYEDRLSSAEEDEMVERRTVQEIMDERFNKPEYNSWHKFDRRRGMPKKQFRKDDEDEDKIDHMDTIPDYSDEESREKQAEYEYVCGILRKNLKPQQAEMLISIVLDGMPVSDYAKREGVSVSAISHRLETAKNNFKKIFPKSSNFTSSQG